MSVAGEAGDALGARARPVGVQACLGTVESSMIALNSAGARSGSAMIRLGSLGAGRLGIVQVWLSPVMARANLPRSTGFMSSSMRIAPVAASLIRQ